MKNKNPLPEDKKIKSSRRSFLGRLGLVATLIAIAGQAFAFFRSLIPNTLYEQPQRFKIGLPDEFGEGSKFLEDSRLFIFREKNTFYAISAVCTHLGCTVKMQKLNQAKKVKAGDREMKRKQNFYVRAMDRSTTVMEPIMRALLRNHFPITAWRFRRKMVS